MAKLFIDLKTWLLYSNPFDIIQWNILETCLNKSFWKSGVQWQRQHWKNTTLSLVFHQSSITATLILHHQTTDTSKKKRSSSFHLLTPSDFSKTTYRDSKMVNVATQLPPASILRICNYCKNVISTNAIDLRSKCIPQKQFFSEIDVMNVGMIS